MSFHELPAHASPVIRPSSPSPTRPGQHTSNFDIDIDAVAPLPSILTPATTPPATPGAGAGDHRFPKKPRSIPVDTRSSHNGIPASNLLQELPLVECIVRARIPTTGGRQMFLHLYKNNVDNKEHLAIVFGSQIRSRSLDAEQPGETEQDRMIRGAYVGTLYPGRTSSRLEELARESANGSVGSAGGSPLLRGLQKAKVEGQKDRDADRLDQLPLALRPFQNKSADEQKGSASGRAPAAYMNSSTSAWGAIRASENTSSISPIPQRSPHPITHEAMRAHAHTSDSEIPLVRIHSECYTGETVWSARCDCGEQLDEAARLMSEPGAFSESSRPSTPGFDDEHDHDADSGGVIIYLRQEGRGIGLSEKLKAYNLQDLGSDTYEANLLLRHPADARSYGLATAMLVDLGLGGERGIRLLTNNPDKIRAVEGANREVRVRERVAMVPIAWRTGGKEGVRGKEVEGYLRAKIDQFGHLLDKPL